MIDNSRIINCCDKLILGGLMLFVFVMPFTFHTATLVSVGLLVPLIAWMIKIILKKEFNLTSLFLPILIWGGIVLVSSLNSINPEYSLDEFRKQYLKQILLFFLITNNIREDYEFKYIIYALLLSCLFVSSFTIFGYITKIAVELDRPTGTFRSITRQAMYFLFLTPFSFGVFLNSQKKLLKYGALFVFLLSAWALLLSLIRGVWIACGIVVLILAFRKNWKAGLMVFLSILILVGIVPRVREKIINSFNFSLKSPNEISSGRLILFMNSFTVFKDHPWIGVGYGPHIFHYLAEDYNITCRPNLSPPTSPIYQEPDAHNIYLQLAIETGIVGLVAFLYLLFTFYKSTIRSLNAIKENRTLLLTFILTISGSLLYGFVGYFYKDRTGLLFWLFISMAVSIANNRGRREIIA